MMNGDHHSRAIHYSVEIDCPSCPPQASERSRKRRLTGETANNEPPSWKNALVSNTRATQESDWITTQYKAFRDHYRRFHSSDGKYPVSKREFDRNMADIPQFRRKASNANESAELKRQRDKRYSERKKERRRLAVSQKTGRLSVTRAVD